MRVVCQRVTEARVRVGAEIVGEIGVGMCVLLGVSRGDGAEQAGRLAGKVARLRLFPDGDGRFDRSLLDVNGAALVVSQFTLYADCRKGRRPSFADAAPAAQAEALYESFVARAREGRVPVATGQFGARMAVALVNDGPVTLVVDTAGDA
jgi:D-tyrosyl-tRNA(Tyr) deacylase